MIKNREELNLKFYENINRPHPFEAEFEYIVNKEKFILATEILSVFIGEYTSFYGCSIVPDNTDVVLTITLSGFCVEDNLYFLKKIQKINNVTLIPHHGYFEIKIRIENFYDIIQD